MKPVHTKLLVTSGLIWGCSFAILGAAYMCLIFPQRKAGRDINAKLSERREVHKQYKHANSEKSRRQRKETITTLEKKLTLYVAEEIAIDSLPFDIATIANAANVTDFACTSRSIIDESFIEIQNCGYIGYTLIDLEFKSSFDNFARFINTLERHEPVIFIDLFSMARTRDRPKKSIAKLSLSIFVQSPQDIYSEN